jgi:hypothetical protein
MAELTIPKEYRRGFAELLSLVKKDRAQELVAALEEVRPIRNRAALRATVASKVGGIGRRELNELVNTLISLFAVRDNLSVPTPEFVGTISDAMGRIESDDLAFPDRESRESFEAVLAQILEIDSLEIAAKAISLVYEQDHIVHGPPRVLTDIRPIFNSDTAELSIRGAMVTYTLKLEYHEGSEVEELFLALNAEQVDGLIEALERAKSKAEKLEQWVRDSEVRYVEAE